MLTYGNAKGFTLIELMIVVAIIGLLAAIAVPSFIAYRNKARIGANVETANTTRLALSGYASTQSGNAFPMSSEIPDWAMFKTICNPHGATLAATLAEQGLNYFVYHGVSVSGNFDTCDNSVPGNECADYCIIMRVNNVPQGLLGVQVEVRSSGIYRQTY